jgi:GNAT superfamily N-acetyltransferase
MSNFDPKHLEHSIDPSEVPAPVAELFTRESNPYEHRRLVIHAFRKLLRFNNNDGLITYVAEHPAVIDEDGMEVVNQSHMYFADVDQEGAIVGRGTAFHRYDGTDPYYRQKPILTYTETMPERQGQGIGQRRLEVMDTVVQTLHGEPLHSDWELDMEDEVTDQFKKAVREGRAEEYTEENGETRYRFKRR